MKKFSGKRYFYWMGGQAARNQLKPNPKGANATYWPTWARNAWLSGFNNEILRLINE